MLSLTFSLFCIFLIYENLEHIFSFDNPFTDTIIPLTELTILVFFFIEVVKKVKFMRECLMITRYMWWGCAKLDHLILTQGGVKSAVKQSSSQSVWISVEISQAGVAFSFFLLPHTNNNIPILWWRWCSVLLSDLKSSYRFEIISLISLAVYLPWIFDDEVAFLRTDFDRGKSKGLLLLFDFCLCAYMRYWLVGINNDTNMIETKIFKWFFIVVSYCLFLL